MALITTMMAVPLTLISAGSAGAQVFSGSLVDAVQLTLRQEASVSASRQQIATSQGQLLSARAPFDRLWSAGLSEQRSVLPLPAGETAQTSNQTTYQAGLSQRLESGITLNPTVSITRIHDNYTNSTDPSTANVALNVVIPLRKGAGTEVTTAPLKAAAMFLQASRSSFRETQAQAIVKTVSTYWDLVAARQGLELALQAESRADELFAKARKLARADEIPRSDLLKYEVRKVAQESDRLRATLRVNQALQALSQAMNSPIETLEAPSRGLDAFPKAEDARLALLDDPLLVARLLAGSVERRTDIKVAEQQLRAANTLAEAARRNSGTQLDLGFSVGYNGMTEGSSGASILRAFAQPAPGANVGVTLTYTLPGGDFERQGLILQRDAAARQAQTELDALRLRASGEVRTQLDALRSTIAQLGKSSDQRRLQTTIYENEKRSYQAGLSTLLDLFSTESQLTVYQIEWVQAQRNFAQALVLFRFKSANLLSLEAGDADDQDVNLLQADSLTTLPQYIYEK